MSVRCADWRTVGEEDDGGECDGSSAHVVAEQLTELIEEVEELLEASDMLPSGDGC